MRMNQPLHTGTIFDVLYIVRRRLAGVNVVDTTYSLARKSRSISGCNISPSLGYKGRGKGTEMISRFVEDEVLLDWYRALFLYLYLFCCSLHVLGRLPLLRGKPECFRQRLHLALSLWVVCMSVSARALTSLPVVILFRNIFVLFIVRSLIASSLCVVGVALSLLRVAPPSISVIPRFRALVVPP